MVKYPREDPRTALPQLEKELNKRIDELVEMVKQLEKRIKELENQ